jgi:type II secretory pathway component PulF
MLAYVVDRLRKAESGAAARARLTGMYVAAVLGFTLLLVLGFTVLVLPKFFMIFADFRITLPAATRALYELSRRVNESGLALLAGGFLLLVFVVGCFAMMERALIGRIAWGAPLRWLGDAVGAVVPPIGSLRRDRAMADLCFALSEAVGAGLGLIEAIHEASHLYMPGSMRRRVLRWGAAMEAGRTTGEAARRAKMPPIVAGLVGSARTSADMAAALGFCARHYEYRVSRTSELLRGAVMPLAVIAMGTLVGWIVLALLMPLHDIIQSVLDNTGLTG